MLLFACCQVAIFNWKNTFQKNAILEQLGVMILAAERVKVSDESAAAEDESGAIFGHLNMCAFVC
jgi:hypothetical protein